jgi:type IV secretory pathway TrbD component
MPNRHLARTLKSAIAYFALVFGAGFMLGIIRVLWVVPHFGARLSELMEMPIMLVVVVGAARWVVRRLAVPSTLLDRLSMGILGLGLLLAAEFGLVLWVRDLSISEYAASRDPVSSAAYYVMLGVFAIMPLLVSRKRHEAGVRSS